MGNWLFKGQGQGHGQCHWLVILNNMYNIKWTTSRLHILTVKDGSGSQKVIILKALLFRQLWDRV